MYSIKSSILCLTVLLLAATAQAAPTPSAEEMKEMVSYKQSEDALKRLYDMGAIDRNAPAGKSEIKSESFEADSPCLDGKCDKSVRGTGIDYQSGYIYPSPAQMTIESANSDREIENFKSILQSSVFVNVTAKKLTDSAVSSGLLDTLSEMRNGLQVSFQAREAFLDGIPDDFARNIERANYANCMAENIKTKGVYGANSICIPDSVKIPAASVSSSAPLESKGTTLANNPLLKLVDGKDGINLTSGSFRLSSVIFELLKVNADKKNIPTAERKDYDKLKSEFRRFKGDVQFSNYKPADDAKQVRNPQIEIVNPEITDDQERHGFFRLRFTALIEHMKARCEYTKKQATNIQVDKTPLRCEGNACSNFSSDDSNNKELWVTIWNGPAQAGEAVFGAMFKEYILGELNNQPVRNLSCDALSPDQLLSEYEKRTASSGAVPNNTTPNSGKQWFNTFSTWAELMAQYDRYSHQAVIQRVINEAQLPDELNRWAQALLIAHMGRFKSLDQWHDQAEGDIERYNKMYEILGTVPGGATSGGAQANKGR